MELIYFFSVLALGFIVITIYDVFKSKKRLRKRIIENFGQIPSSRANFESIKAYHLEASEYHKQRLIDEITWNDLEMDEVYKRINNTGTSVGEEYLYHVLHQCPLEVDDIERRESLIEWLEQHPDERVDIQVILAGCGKEDYNNFSHYLFHSEHNRLPFSFIFTILGNLPWLFIIGLLINSTIFGALIFLSLIINMIVNYIFSKRISPQLQSIRYFSKILWCAGKLSSYKNSEFQYEIKPLSSSFNVFKALKNKTSALVQKKTNEIDILVEYVQILFLRNIRKYNKTMAMITSHQKELISLYESLGELDLSISILSYRKSLLGYCLPAFTSAKELDFSELYHPLLKEPIKNTKVLKDNIILTGSNASGKSTFIKAIALNTLLGQNINTCSADYFITKPSFVITSMAIRDDLMAGESYFIKEIKSLKRILDTVKELYCLCIVDEILRGTNTIERISASSAVLNFLDKENGMAIIASHDIELTELLKSSYGNYHFREQITNEGISFDYLLKEGPSRTRNAIKLLEFMGFSREIVDEAFANAKKMESSL